MASTEWFVPAHMSNNEPALYACSVADYNLIVPIPVAFLHLLAGYNVFANIFRKQRLCIA
jgi:hypothetical protein